MRAIAGLAMFAALGCQSATRRHTPPPPPPPPAKPMPRQLTLGAIDRAAVEVASGDELARELLAHRRAIAHVIEIVEVSFRGHTFDRDALADMIATNYDGASRPRFKARYGLDYADVWNAFVHGYAAQLEQRFGITTTEVAITLERERWLVIIRGTLAKPDSERPLSIEWKSGVFESHGSATTTATLRAMPKSAETVLLSDREDYYNAPELKSYPARFRSTGDEPVGPRLFRSTTLRTYREPAEYVDATGQRFRRDVLVSRYTPNFIVRPGGFDRLGLKKPIHLVHVELDTTAEPGSSPLIESVTVIDGTPAFPVDLAAVYARLRSQFEGELGAAKHQLRSEIATLVASFAARTKQWAAQQVPSGTLQSSTREYSSQQPSFAWDPATATLTITIHGEHTVVFEDRITFKNPRLDSFHCSPGAPCAVPPSELEHEQSQRYSVVVDVTYEIDRDGTVRKRGVKGPQLGM